MPRCKTMPPPLTLSFRGIHRSGALEDRARELSRRLERCGDRIAECRMTLEGPDGRRDLRAPYLVKIDLSLPGAHIHADSLHADGAGHADIYLALRDAYSNAKRQLQDLHRERVGSARGSY
ncbi:MAG TPA: HPF/RaiA family ribosome-associated protein [Steroidobacteraceae bacterium]|nr:HPF/RaiA family ribosome-associated protein [Steroidobacteraceae bacterium]